MELVVVWELDLGVHIKRGCMILHYQVQQQSVSFVWLFLEKNIAFHHGSDNLQAVPKHERMIQGLESLGL